jgi:hypothetical protein
VACADGGPLMRPDQLHGYHATHEKDRLPRWMFWGLVALALAGVVTAEIWIERIAPHWL